jgi:hypothetical protein
MSNPMNNPLAFELVEARSVKRGTDRIKVKAKAVPVGWSQGGGFAVSVELGPNREDDRWRPLAVDFHDIPTLGTGGSSAPDGSVDYEPVTIARPATTDDVAIRIIAPSGPAIRGVEAQFEFDVDYTFDTAAEGVVSVAFNTAGPNTDRIVELRPITRGSGRLRIKTKVTPVDWGERGGFHASVSLGPKLDGTTTSWTSIVRRIVEIPTAP